MTKLERKLKERERRAINAVNKSADDIKDIYDDALKALFYLVLVLVGIVLGMYISAARTQAATTVSIPPRCEYVGPITDQVPEELPVAINEMPVATMPDAVMVEQVGERWESLGKWKLSFYCPCRQCSSGWGHQTSSGATCVEGVTVACAILPAGTRVKIDGYGERIVQDTGAGVRGQHLDVFMESHSECLRHGLKYREVWIKR